MSEAKKKKKPLNRYNVMTAIMGIIFIAILSRVIYLQVFRYDDYSEKANTKSRRFLSEKAPRGKIYDSEGNILATNKQTYTVTFTETDESKEKFYTTMDQVYALLQENGETIQDTFKLRINDNNELYFDFNTDSEETRIAQELRFKKDKGLNDEIQKKLYPKVEGDLTVEQEEKIDEYLLKVTPQETFYYLVKQYSLYYALNPTKDEAKAYANMNGEELTSLLLNKFTLSELRGYMLIKDAIKMQSFSGYKPVTLASNIQEETAFVFYQKLNDLPGVDVSLEPVRYYPYESLASSVLGYVSSINSANQSRYEERGYDVSTDLIGKAGIESAFESTLRGTKGGTTVTVNSAGRKLQELYTLESYPGNNVHLTIDKDIQYAAEEMLKYQLNYLQTKYRGDVDTSNANRGAAVAIEIETGRVLALASAPDFDPNIFAYGELSPELSEQYFNPDLESFGNSIISRKGLSVTVDDLFPKNKDGLREDKYDLYPKPFYNYATMGLLSPGSIFKPLSTVVALEEGVFSPTETIQVNSRYFNKYPEIFGDQGPKDANYIGTVDSRVALEKSSNSYYYETAIRLYRKYGSTIEGLDSIAKYAWKFGLGVDPNSNQKASTGLEISENFGSTYSFQEFKDQKIYYAKWTLVDSLEAGMYSTGVKFPSVDIAINSSDSDELAKAKVNLKESVTSKLNEIGTRSIKGDFDKYNEEIKLLLEELYKVSPKYQQSIADSGWNVNKAIDTAAYQTANWVVYSMSTEITSAVELANAAIGQGMNYFTPVQLASYMATLGSEGTRYKVHLVDKITNPEGEIIDEYKPEVLDTISISQSTMSAVKEGMRRAQTTGTARATFSNFPIVTGGKTGTATFRNDQEKYGRSDAAVYAAIAPLDDPKIAVAVVIYDGGHGSLAAPVARAIFESYFRDELKTNYPGYTPTTIDGVKYDWSLNPPIENIKDDSSLEENVEGTTENIDEATSQE